MTDANKNNSKGFTLIELIVALGLSSIVVAAGFALFVNSNKIYQSSGQTSMIQQSARASLDIMATEIQMAGFGALDPAAVDLLTSGVLQDQETAFPVVINSNSDSDMLMMRVSQGGMTISNAIAPLSSVTCDDATCGIMVLANMGHDLFANGARVEIMDLNRTRILTGYLGSISGLLPNQINLQNGYVLEPDFATIGDLPLGVIVLQQPIYLSFYRNSDDQLIRCARTNWPGACDGSNMDRTPTQTNQDSMYVLTNDVVDLQFSYMVEDAVDPTLDATWIPTNSNSFGVMDYETRKRIKAIKIELLLQSESQNPLISEKDCALMKTKYSVGDREITVPCNYTYMQMSTIVNIPNAYFFPAI